MRTARVEICGRSLTVAPLRLRQIGELVETPPSDESVSKRRERLVAICAAALANADAAQPDAAQLEELLDLEGLGQLIKATLAVSGLAPPGEAEPVAAQASSASTATS